MDLVTHRQLGTEKLLKAHQGRLVTVKPKLTKNMKSNISIQPTNLQCSVKDYPIFNRLTCWYERLINDYIHDLRSHMSKCLVK